MNNQPQRRSSATQMRAMARVLILLIISAQALLSLSGCVTTRPAELAGIATYRERIALPPGAVFEAALQEVSQNGKTGKVLGRTIIDPAGQPPFRFKIAYDEAAIRPQERYAVTATVKRDGQVLFTTHGHKTVLAGDKTPLNIMMISAHGQKQPAVFAYLPASYEREVPGANSLIRWHLDLLPGGHYQLRMTYLDKPEPNQFDQIGRWQYDREHGGLTLLQSGQSPFYFAVEADGSVLRQRDSDGTPIESRHDAPLQRLPGPALIEPRLKLTGMFTYMADAASITLCDDDRRLPVAMEADYRALERAYTQTDPQPGQALLVTLDGEIAYRPSPEESQPPRATLIVERFVDISSRETCGQAPADNPLRGTYWKLVSLEGEPIQVADRKREPHLIFATEEQRVSGSGGCNRVTGGFDLGGDKLRLRQMAGTMMACPAGMDQESRFLQSLSKVERYHISGDHLELLDASGTVLVRFEAVTLP